MEVSNVLEATVKAVRNTLPGDTGPDGWRCGPSVRESYIPFLMG